MTSTLTKFFFIAFLAFFPSFLKAECPQPRHCACIEKYGRCDCPHGQCACVENGPCLCAKPTTSLQVRHCACLEKYGRCDCPYGQCACVEKGPCLCVKNQETQTIYSETTYLDDTTCDEQTFVEPVNEDLTCCPNVCPLLPLPQHQFYIGPEIYYAERSKAGKYARAKQDGWIFGGRVGYDRIKRCRIYWGIDALYASGELEGKRTHTNKIKLCFTDENIEGRLGYTFQMKCRWLPTIVPFIGYGYYRETNKFRRPSPILLKQRIEFDYVALGFLSQFYPHPLWVVGVNFKARVLFNSKCKISDDPDYEDLTQNIEHHVQYRVEVPLTYRLNCWCNNLAIALVPFYEYRHYGEHANFPFDFKDAKLNFYGFDVRLMYAF